VDASRCVLGADDPLEAPPGDPAEDIVERPEEANVDPLEDRSALRRCAQADAGESADFPVQLRRVEVGGEHGREGYESRRGENRLSRDMSDSTKTTAFTRRSASVSRWRPRSVTRPVMRASWPSVLSRSVLSAEDGRCEQPSVRERKSCDETGQGIREDDRGRGDSCPGKDRREGVRERPEDALEQELAAGPPRLWPAHRLGGCILGCDRHCNRS
jgi:hypothetical protein